LGLNIDGLYESEEMNDPNQLFEVEKIVKHKEQGKGKLRQIYLLVKWKGYT